MALELISSNTLCKNVLHKKIDEGLSECFKSARLDSESLWVVSVESEFSYCEDIVLVLLVIPVVRMKGNDHLYCS